MSVGFRLWLERSIILPAPRLPPFAVHAKVATITSSGSDVIAEQDRVSSLWIPEDGAMAVEETIGSVFSMVTESVDIADSPSESVAVALQRTEFPTSVSAAETV